MTKTTVIDGIVVEEDTETGKTTFRPLPKEASHEAEAAVDTRSWIQRLVDWFNTAPVTPYAKRRDLSDPFGDRQDGDGSKAGYEIGIKVRF